MIRSLQDEVTKYLTDAHSIEVQALKQLERPPGVAEDPAFERALREHRRETEGHERRIAELLESRGAEPSALKDGVMEVGGEGFVLFARSHTDSPGRLASHVLSYEALEWASYDLLARTAERAGESAVAETAREIQSEEWAMMERIEGLFDATAAASLAGVTTDDVGEHLQRYLADAHALEQQSVHLLKSGIVTAEGTALEAVLREHLETTRGQSRRIEERLDALDASPSLLQDTALRLGALGWSMFVQAHPDTPARLAAFAYAVEHLEIGGYEQLRRVAERAGDDGTAIVVSEILEEERRAAGAIRETFEEALTGGLRGRQTEEPGKTEAPPEKRFGAARVLLAGRLLC